jgi:EmrB/QacA subfamily drug resistance transporter
MAEPGRAPLDPRRWIALGVVLTASFMVLLDISIVNVAIPSIQVDLKARYSDIQWVIAGYGLAYGVGLITGGRLGDIYGRKLMFQVGVTGFTLASAACGLAQSPLMLVISRVVQGLCASIMYPQVLSVIQVMFPPRERGTAFGIFGAIIGVATISGPIAGGLLIQANILNSDWRPIFLVNVPIGIGAVIAAARLLHESKAPTAPKLDLAGVAIVTAGLLLVTYPLVEGRDAGWPAWTFISMIAALPVLAVFGIYVRGRARRGGSPLIEPSLFADRAFVIGMVVMVAFFAGVPAFFFTASLYLQIGFGFTALQAGATLIPFAVGSAIASGASIRLAPRIGKRILNIGALILVLGVAAVYVTAQAAGTGMKGYYFVPALFVCGLGLGSVVAPLATIVLTGIHSANAGSASGVLTTVQQLGGAVGIALVGVIFFGQLTGNADTVAGGLKTQVQEQLVLAGVPFPAAQAGALGFVQCFDDRAAASDPTVTPPSCKPPAGARPDPAIARVFTDNARAGLEQNFLIAFKWALVYEAVAFAVVFLLVFALPRPERAALHEAETAAA